MVRPVIHVKAWSTYLLCFEIIEKKNLVNSKIFYKNGCDLRVIDFLFCICNISLGLIPLSYTQLEQAKNVDK
jgi:hypothetical protein